MYVDQPLRAQGWYCRACGVNPARSATTTSAHPLLRAGLAEPAVRQFTPTLERDGQPPHSAPWGVDSGTLDL